MEKLFSLGMRSVVLLILATFAVGCIKPVDKPSQDSKGPLRIVIEDNSAEDKADAVEEHKGLKVADWRKEHMTFLNTKTESWKEEGCLDCHDNTQTFCNSCHNYVGALAIAAVADEDGGEGEASDESESDEDSEDSDGEEESSEDEEEEG